MTEERPTRDERWFAVLTLPQQEARAFSELRNQNFKSFLPQQIRSVRHARQTQMRLRPLFPRYLFVSLDPARARWRSINGTIGVAYIVGFGDGPTPVPRGVVEALVAASDARGVVSFEDHFQPGTPIRLAAGPFAEQLGVLSRLDGRDAVRVLLNIMGSAIEVRVKRDLVLPAA